MEPKLMNPQEIGVLLGGVGHPPLCKAALAGLVKQGMPTPVQGKYDPVASLTWYIGKMRRDLLLDLVSERMKGAIDAASEEMTGKGAREVRRIWRKHTLAALDGVAART